MHAFDPQDPISALPKPRNHKKTRYPLHKSTKQAEFACFRPRNSAEKPCFLATVLVESRGCAPNLRGLRDISWGCRALVRKRTMATIMSRRENCKQEPP